MAPVGDGVNTTLLSDTRQSIDLTECVTRAEVWIRKKTMNLCGCEGEENEDGVGPDVKVTIMSDVLY